MIGSDELNHALTVIRDYEQNGPEFDEWLKDQNIDCDAVIECGFDHAQTLLTAGMISPMNAREHAVSFIGGFTIAVMVMQLAENENNA